MSDSSAMGMEVANAYPLLASWINLMLFMLELSLMVQYFRTSRPLVHRIGVAAILFCDVVCTAAVCVEVYMYILVFPCETVLTKATARPLAAIVFATYGTASLEQLFLCSLYFVLTKQHLVTAFLVATVMLHFASSYAAGILVMVGSSMDAFQIAKVGLISCAITDILIAAALLFTFIRMEQTSAARASTHSLLRRLMLLVFTSGLVVASTTMMVTVLALSNSPAYNLFFYAQGRVYALTILCNFLVGASKAQTPTVTSVPGSTITGVVFHVEYNPTGTHREVVTCNRGSDPLDNDIETEHGKSQSLAD